MDPHLRLFQQQAKRCPTGKRQHEKERRNQHPSWDTGHSDIYSGVQKKRWRTYWQYDKLHSITGAAGRPASREQRSKISSGARSPESLWSLALSDFNLLHHQARIHCEGQMRVFLFTDVSHQAARKALHLHRMIHTAEKKHFRAWWCQHSPCQHLHAMNHTCLSDSDQCLGAFEGSASFENNVARVSQLVRSLAFVQGARNVNSSQPKREAVVLM